MADTKITALAAITTVDPAADVLPIVDISDTSMAASGTTKKITSNQILGSGGTATLASATITGDLTVDTSTLKVDSANNRVGIGTATPATDLHIFKSSATDNALIQLQNGTASSYIGTRGTTYGAVDAGDTYIFNSSGNDIVLMADNAAGAIKFAAGGNTESMRLNSTGLGVGLTPSGGAAGSVFSAGAVLAAGGLTANQTNRGVLGYSTNETTIRSYGATAGTGFITFRVAGGGGSSDTEAMRIDASSNVGIGVTPSAWLAAVKALDIGSNALAAYSGGITHNAYFDNTDSRWEYKGIGAASFYSVQGGLHAWYVAASGTANTAITTFSSAAMTLDASGNLLVGTTTNTGSARIYTEVNGNGHVVKQMSAGGYCFGANAFSNGGTYYLTYFEAAGTAVGSITSNGTGVTYGTLSDYRLKEAVAPLVGGLARVNALKPSIYNWKSNGSTGEGFLAHELAEVVPAAVTGEKDAVNEDGSIKAQSIDMSRVVPILVAAIQELTARVQTLETR